MSRVSKSKQREVTSNDEEEVDAVDALAVILNHMNTLLKQIIDKSDATFQKKLTKINRRLAKLEER